MNRELETENVYIQIRDKLLKEDIKLWLPPYYIEEEGIAVVQLQKLANTYSIGLSIPSDQCYSAIYELQTHALEKLRERERFKVTGNATVKVRLPIEINGTKIQRHEILLSSFGLDLKKLVAHDIDITANRIKLICMGKVIKDTESLNSQGVKNGCQILALLVEENNTDIQEAEKLVKDAENVKEDTKLLSSDNNDTYMQLEDQHGNRISLPKREKAALLVAMALHEKGKAALKKEQYNAALVMFLDADKEYCMCSSQLLDSVDNYALLNLDIVWCYLCLQSISQLPEADKRLKTCEESFKRSYGPNLERLLTLKGHTGNEAALLMRLHLLQAIVMFHQNRRNESLDLLLNAESELQNLKVDEKSITVLLEQGFSSKEARLGLRSTHGCINAAAEYILENRKQKQEARKQAIQDAILEQERKKLGKCADGKQWVEPKFVKMLQDMGYPKEAAKIALQKSNNNVSLSVQYIQDQPELLNLAGPSSSKSQELMELARSLSTQLEAAGFDARMARLALEKHGGDFLKAIDDLLANDGIIEGFPFEDDADAEKKKAKEEAFKRLSEGMANEDDDYLDLSLDQEEVFLQQYKSLLMSGLK